MRVLTFLRDDAGLLFKELVDLCGVDYPARERRFDVVYHLLSLHHNQRIRVKVETDEATPVPSVDRRCSRPPTGSSARPGTCTASCSADHPDLRRILTDYGFEGHPLRKDFPMTGYVEMRYDEEQKRVVYEPVKLRQDFRNLDFLSPWEGSGGLLPGDEKAAPEPAPPAGAKDWIEDAMPDIQMRNYTINFGPQHPAAHGVLRLLLEMDGEVVERADPHIGLLHRGTEKFIEIRPYLQIDPLLRPPRLLLAADAGARLRARGREAAGHRGAGAARSTSASLFDELTRILNHLLNVTTFALDVGAMTPLLWMFEEREKLMEFYEAVSGPADARQLLPLRRRQPRPAERPRRADRAPGWTSSSPGSTTSTTC